MSPPRPDSIPRFGEQVWAEQRYPLTPSEWRYLATCGDDCIERLTLARPDVPPEIGAAAAENHRKQTAEAVAREIAAARAEAAQLRAELAAVRAGASGGHVPAQDRRAAAKMHRSDPYHAIPRFAEFEQRTGHYSDGTMDGALAVLSQHRAEYERMTRTGMYADCRME